MIRVLLVTEIQLIGNIVAAILEDESDIEVVGCATTPDGALARMADTDVLLVSPRLPQGGALELTTAVVESYPAVKILAFGLTISKARVLKYVEAGADGYVAKDDSVEDLVRRIRTAYQGKADVSPEIVAALMARVTKYAQLYSEVESGLHEDAALTPREREILELIGEGLTNQEIADRLIIEVGTVKNHVHNILQKLDVGSRQDAAAYLPLLE
ncbi:MAG: response regulator transcription factor [Anaerolineae bacterium]|jgi:DNA-binding NarL/FixJ family response regulator